MVACHCGVGGEYPPCGTPVDDDGHEFTYDGHEWVCWHCWDEYLREAYEEDELRASEGGASVELHGEVAADPGRRAGGST
jgi:hypothetical protein